MWASTVVIITDCAKAEVALLNSAPSTFVETSCGPCIGIKKSIDRFSSTFRLHKDRPKIRSINAQEGKRIIVFARSSL